MAPGFLEVAQHQLVKVIIITNNNNNTYQDAEK